MEKAVVLLSSASPSVCCIWECLQEVLQGDSDISGLNILSEI